MVKQGVKNGRSYNVAIAGAQRWATRLHSAVFRATDGRIGGRMLGSPVLLLITKGRKTGRERTTPLLYLEDGGRYAIVASNGGTATHPAWWLNLRADPGVAVEVAGKRIRVRARETGGEERTRLWKDLVRMYPPYQDYQNKTEREIPVILLEPPDRITWGPKAPNERTIS